MLEKFTQEEIEQIKAELGFVDKQEYLKQDIISTLKEKTLIDALIPKHIMNYRNLSRNNRTESVISILTDAITGNYGLSRKGGVCFQRSIPGEQRDFYVSVYREIAENLRRIYEKHLEMRAANIAQMLQEGNEKKRINAQVSASSLFGDQ